MAEGLLCRRLEWDCEFFGFPIARLLPERLDPDRLSAALSWCRAERIRCLYFLADPDDGQTARLCAGAGFRSVDVRVTLARELEAGLPGPEGRAIRPFASSDLPALKAIARVSHVDSRFYHDPGFERSRCDALYETWLERSCSGFAQAVLVAEENRRPAGYLTCHQDGDCGRIGLVAVGAGFQGKGLGRALIQAGLAWFSERGVREATVVTQGRNSAALRLYRGAGFTVQSERDWYHLWF